jgi:Vacuolar-sorting-associated 13 protein C-terminal
VEDDALSHNFQSPQQFWTQCLKSATVAPRNLAIKVDLAFLVRLQKFALDVQHLFQKEDIERDDVIAIPDFRRRVTEMEAAAASGVGRQKVYFGGLTILPCNIRLSVAPARALNPAQATLEGPEIAAIHQAVRKGDVLLGKKNTGLLGVKIGSRNKTPLAVVRGMFKSFIVDGLLRLDGASLNFAGVSLRNHTSTGPQLTTSLGAHYLASLRQNLPALVGSMAAFGNPLGLVRGEKRQ